MPPTVQEKAARHQRQFHHDRDDHAGLDLDAGSGRHTGGLRHLCQVPGQEGFTAQLQGIEIHRAGYAAQYRHAQRRQRRQPEDPVQQQPDQKQEQPCQQIGLGMGENKACNGVRRQRTAGDPLAQQHRDQRCRQRERHAGHQKRLGSFQRIHGSDPFHIYQQNLLGSCFCTSLLRLL